MNFSRGLGTLYITQAQTSNAKMDFDACKSLSLVYIIFEAQNLELLYEHLSALLTAAAKHRVAGLG